MKTMSYSESRKRDAEVRRERPDRRQLLAGSEPAVRYRGDHRVVQLPERRSRRRRVDRERAERIDVRCWRSHAESIVGSSPAPGCPTLPVDGSCAPAAGG